MVASSRSTAGAHRGRLARVALGILAAAGGELAVLPAAQADLKIFYPIVDYHEFEFEHNGDTTFDKPNSGKSNNQSYTFDVIGYAPVRWWEPELELETGAAPGTNLTYGATTLENIFQLTPQGKYWADLGFYAEYSHAASSADPDSITFGPLVQKQAETLFGLDLGHDTLHTLNLFVTKEIGRNRSEATPLSLAWQSRLQLDSHFQPGFEYYGNVSSISGASTGTPLEQRLGPVMVGQYNMFQYGTIKYEVGYLFGLNRATERGTVRWRFEYEKAF